MKRKGPAYIYDRSQLPEMLTVAETAAFVRTSEQTIRNRIKSGKIKALVDGNVIRIQRNEVLEYIGLKT